MSACASTAPSKEAPAPPKPSETERCLGGEETVCEAACLSFQSPRVCARACEGGSLRACGRVAENTAPRSAAPVKGLEAACQRTGDAKVCADAAARRATFDTNLESAKALFQKSCQGGVVEACAAEAKVMAHLDVPLPPDTEISGWRQACPVDKFACGLAAAGEVVRGRDRHEAANALRSETAGYQGPPVAQSTLRLLQKCLSETDDEYTTAWELCWAFEGMVLSVYPQQLAALGDLEALYPVTKSPPSDWADRSLLPAGDGWSCFGPRPVKGYRLSYSRDKLPRYCFRTKPLCEGARKLMKPAQNMEASACTENRFDIVHCFTGKRADGSPVVRCGDPTTCGDMRFQGVTKPSRCVSLGSWVWRP